MCVMQDLRGLSQCHMVPAKKRLNYFDGKITTILHNSLKMAPNGSTTVVLNTMDSTSSNYPMVRFWVEIECFKVVFGAPLEVRIRWIAKDCVKIFSVKKRVRNYTIRFNYKTSLPELRL